MRISLIICILISLAQAAVIAGISAIESQYLVKNGQAVLIDVRETLETKTGIAKGARLLPMSKMNDDRISFDKEIATIPKDKTLIVYCASGRRARIVGEELEKKGYKVLSMGTFNSWKNAGLPIEVK